MLYASSDHIYVTQTGSAILLNLSRLLYTVLFNSSDVTETQSHDSVTLLHQTVSFNRYSSMFPQTVSEVNDVNENTHLNVSEHL